jgi:ectoine hydroxylase-related dioxygenase (phytanoyl-CoA dioxygenase family)
MDFGDEFNRPGRYCHYGRNIWEVTMNTDTNLPLAQKRARTTWLNRDDATIEDFAKQVNRTTNLADWPHAADCQSNILIYEGEALEKADQDDEMRRSVTAELAHCLREGPGVFAIKGAMRNHDVIDRATEIFDDIITAEREGGGGAGDHFAKPGANDRIWNALQKHCLADPQNFAAYYGVPAVGLAALAWLGPGYQMTAQVNRVNPGGAAQSAHRDYHLGFMTTEQAMEFPGHCHELSPLMTLQGALAHCDMPIESGPTMLLPYSQNFSHGYVLFETAPFQEFFLENKVQLPLEKGDAVFFSPALMHAAGANTSTDIRRMANLLQVSSAFGRAMENIDRTAMAKALYPALKRSGDLSARQRHFAIAACAEGYAFPTSLDNDPPVNGLAPKTPASFMAEALASSMDAVDFNAELDAMKARRID